MQLSQAIRLAALRPVGHDTRLSVVDHLEELRTRLIVSLLALVVAFGVCYSQRHQLLNVINAPLARQTQQQVRAGHGPLGRTYSVQLSARDVAKQLDAVVGALRSSTMSNGTRGVLAGVDRHLQRDIVRLSAPPTGNAPVTLGIGEPFTTTVTVTLIFALIFVAPILLLQAYGFLAPGLEPGQRRRLAPIVYAVPVLFGVGVAFGYFVVLPAALHFLQGFDAGQFNVLVQASRYYRFAATLLLAMGLLFEVPVAILGVTGAGLVTPGELSHNRRYAMLACGLVAAVLPGDPVTMMLETLPLYLLFELSVLIARYRDRRAGHTRG